MNLRRIKIVIILIFINVCGLEGENIFRNKLLYDASLLNILDNREYRSKAYSQSIMASRLNFDLGLEDENGNKLFAGLNYMYEYGSDIDDVAPIVNLYYTYSNDKVDFYMGSFPKDKVINFPLFMLSDSLCYYNPNIGGMGFAFKRDWGKETFFIDWNGRQSIDRKESFVAGFSGNENFGSFYSEHYFYMYHLALTKNAPLDEHIRDNGVGCAFLGYDFSKKISLDVLKLDFGGIVNYDRQRPKGFSTNVGTIFRLFSMYKRVGLDVCSYFGDRLDIPLGDQLYLNGNYTRIDLKFIPIKFRNVKSLVKMGFHVVDGILISSQQMTLVFDL